ncbi:MAG: CpaD family pilus assembly lipoprotein [Rickettsiales bacterium]
MKTYLMLGLTTLALTGCSEIPGEAYYNRGTPESLLDVSSEVVTLQVSSQEELDEVTRYIDEDQPTRAEIYCMDGDMMCGSAEQTLNLYGVEYEVVPSATSEVHLIYERVLARDCENRYIDNSINPYNLNHPTFGCSLASNLVQMVSDKRQFVSPSLLDPMDGEKAGQVYRSYLMPAKKPVQTDSEDFKIDQIKQD